MKQLLLMTALATAAALPATPTEAAELRNEVALQWMPNGLTNDGRRSRDIAYNRDFGNGWALGGSLGYGNVHSAKSDDGLLALLRVRWRAPGLNGLPWLQPQLGLEYGGTSNVSKTADLAAVFAGVHMAASPELGFTLDYISGRSHYEELFNNGSRNERRTVSGVRIGLAIRY